MTGLSQKRSQETQTEFTDLLLFFFMTKFLFKGISHQLTEYARRDDNAVTVQNEEGFS